MTFDENGRRLSGNDPVRSEDQILIVGGSCTQGWAVGDSDTYAWKLQRRFSSQTVLNCGTAGYGTYQSLLLMERILPELSGPRIVLYGFIDHHEVRNVATDTWLRNLAIHSRLGHVQTPFVCLDDNHALLRHKPEGWSTLPFRESLAIVQMTERVYMKYRTRKRFDQRRAVTELLMLEMNRVASEHDASFFVVLLLVSDPARAQYRGFLQKHNVRLIDCAQPLVKEMTVPGEIHPNGRMHTLWARQIAEALMHSLPASGSETASPARSGV